MDHPLKNEDWRDIAAEASKEMDPEKLTRLVTQLCESLDERNKIRQKEKQAGAA